MYLILLLVGAFILFITAIKIAVWYEKVHRKYVNWKEHFAQSVIKLFILPRK